MVEQAGGWVATRGEIQLGITACSLLSRSSFVSFVVQLRLQQSFGLYMATNTTHFLMAGR